MSNLTEEGHKHSEKVQAGLEEDGSSDSSCMVVLKLPSLEDDASASNKGQVSRTPRKKTYKKVAFDNELTSKRCKTKRGRLDSEAHTLALQSAKERQAKLSSEHPSFIKQLQRSHCTGDCQLGIPSEFSRSHMPTHSDEFILEDENAESYMVKYSASSEGKFIGGWKKFSLEHSLLEGDVVVFHLIKPCYFKVYIVRATDPAVVERANISSPNVVANEGKKKKRKRESSHKKGPSPAPPNTIEECGRSSPLPSNSDSGPGSTQSVKDNLRSSDMEAAPLSGRDADFDKFKIIVNGEIVDRDLSRSDRFKYYKLCCSRESYLHEHLLKNVHRTLAAGIITGTLKVADAIRACKIGTSEDDFAMWDDTLEGFKRLGMDVGFLRDRLKRLARLGSELMEKEKVKRYIQAENKQDRIGEEMKSFEVKLLELKGAKEKVEDEMKTLKLSILKHKDAFQQEATAPW